MSLPTKSHQIQIKWFVPGNFMGSATLYVKCLCLWKNNNNNKRTRSSFHVGLMNKRRLSVLRLHDAIEKLILLVLVAVLRSFILYVFITTQNNRTIEVLKFPGLKHNFMMVALWVLIVISFSNGTRCVSIFPIYLFFIIIREKMFFFVPFLRRLNHPHPNFYFILSMAQFRYR